MIIVYEKVSNAVLFTLNVLFSLIEWIPLYFNHKVLFLKSAIIMQLYSSVILFSA